MVSFMEPPLSHRRSQYTSMRINYLKKFLFLHHARHHRVRKYERVGRTVMLNIFKVIVLVLNGTTIPLA